MSTVIDFAHNHHLDRHQLWDRFERADYNVPRNLDIELR